jgi:hypothetical protein
MRAMIQESSGGHKLSAGGSHLKEPHRCIIVCKLISEKTMKKLVFALLLSGAMLMAITQNFAQAGSSEQNIVTAAQVNGTWRNRTGSFKVWALGQQKLRVEFLGSYEYKTREGLMANTGSGSGIAFIEGDTATFKPDADDEDCKITMKFTRGKLVVKQEGACGFGHNVSADGTYLKASSRKPKFNEE